MTASISFIQFKLFVFSKEYRTAIMTMHLHLVQLAIARWLASDLADVSHFVAHGDLKCLSKLDRSLTRRARLASVIGFKELGDLFTLSRTYMREGDTQMAQMAIGCIMGVFPASQAK